jgi:hypothetical protein
MFQTTAKVAIFHTSYIDGDIAFLAQVAGFPTGNAMQFPSHYSVTVS